MRLIGGEVHSDGSHFRGKRSASARFGRHHAAAKRHGQAFLQDRQMSPERGSASVDERPAAPAMEESRRVRALQVSERDSHPGQATSENVRRA